MGYFSNGTEGEMYMEQYCVRCINWRGEDDDQGCPVMDLHFLYNYDACNDDNHPIHHLIPRSEDGLRNEECRMFLQRTDAPPIGQRQLENWLEAQR